MKGFAMNTTQLECFSSVANNLNFARAAEELHITQPAVTHQINTLENELGTKLFKRTTRLVELTPEGLRFLTDARHILQLMQSARAKLSDYDSSNVPFFSIGCHSTTELALFPPILRELLQKYPNLHPNLRTVPFRSLENLLEDSSLDVIFDFKPEIHSKKNTVYEELIQAKLMFVLPKSHPYAHKDALTTEDLENEKLILQEPHHIPPTLFEFQRPFVDSHFYKDLHFCDNSESALTMVKAGLGITMLMDIRPLREESLCYVPFAYPLSLSYGVHYRKQQKTALFKDFLEIAARIFARMGDSSPTDIYYK